MAVHLMSPQIPAIMGIKAHATDKVSSSTFSRDVLRIETREPLFSPSFHATLTSRPKRSSSWHPKVDPEGKRTLGFLTKPDLVLEQATSNAVTGLIKGHRRDLQLGYCVVRNRGADDSTSSLKVRNRAEMEFFSRARALVATRQDQTRHLGTSVASSCASHRPHYIKSEFPKVKREIMDMLKDAKQQLEAMGPARSEPNGQRAYLEAIEQRHGHRDEELYVLHGPPVPCFPSGRT
ncbi:hypothetical protein B0T22DRAFT_445143 [Podospora appendiculata]|uniref:Dynamin stalk domain-containing protein n=1 Tax=Podospora appendiculata TaxID=314037 RepID=A0AAE0X1U7_9PEZI|nr:hypothetical protein B0T22DRAFT_445143 [Podospora appendiculata]